MIVTNVNEIVQKLESFGLEVLIKDGELLIPSYVTHVSTRTVTSSCNYVRVRTR